MTPEHVRCAFCGDRRSFVAGSDDPLITPSGVATECCDDCAVEQALVASDFDDTPITEELEDALAGRLPGFREQAGRLPVPGLDYDPDGALCQDDHEYFSGTGRYF